MFGLLPATSPRAIRTGSWLETEAFTKARGTTRRGASLVVMAAALWLAPQSVYAARPHLAPHLTPPLSWPLEIEGSQYAPIAWADIAGWSEDDHLQAFTAFRISCKPIAALQTPPADPKALGTSLRDPCRAARSADISDGAKARAFF